MSDQEQATFRTVTSWFDALAAHDPAKALAILSDDILWINGPGVKGLSDIIPWLGIFQGLDEVKASFKIWAELSTVEIFELRDIFCKGGEALAIVREKALIKPTGKHYDFEFIQRFTVKDGRIIRWQSYWDTVQGIVAFRKD